MRKPWRGFLVAALAALVVGVPIAYTASRQHHRRNFRVVEDGVLYRSGQLTPAGFDAILADFGIKTVVTLRAVDDPKGRLPAMWEGDYCTARGVKHVRLVPQVWGPDEKGEVPSDVTVRRFLEVMDDPANHPVLVHCMAGIHRTGQVVAVFRMERHRWPVDRAMAEMEYCGYEPEEMHEHVRSYLKSYKPRWSSDVQR